MESPGDPPRFLPAAEDLPRIYARVFLSADGRVVLDHLRSQSVDRCLSPEVSENALRWLESRRSLVRSIEAMVRRGARGGVSSRSHDAKRNLS